MAMSKEALGKAISDLVIDATAPADVKAKIIAQWTDIAGAIIDEIKKATITVSAGIPVTTIAPYPTTGATSGTGSATIT